MMKIDERDDWSDEDLADATLSSLQYAELSGMHSEFADWLLLSDDDLWKIAKSTFEEAKRVSLEALIERQKRRSLTETEQTTLAQLLLESQELMLHKAEAQHLLAQRGIQVYPKPNFLPTN
ncbi:MAG: hypothetical protein KDE19_08450 [Caldilineaceae bacterium]|nr:hypothetical protein [Caldilineaceae bacterium]